MALRLPQMVAMASLVLFLPLAGCAPTVGLGGPPPAGSAPSASADGRDLVASAPEPVTSFLAAVQQSDLDGALALTDPNRAPAGTDTAQNVYRFLGTGAAALQTWRFVGETATSDGGEWAFVVCQVQFADGWRSEVPLTFKTDARGKIVFVG